MTAQLLIAVLISLLQINTHPESQEKNQNRNIIYLIEGKSLPAGVDVIFRDTNWALTFDYLDGNDSVAVSAIMPDVPGEYYFLRIKSADDLNSLSGVIPYVTFDDMAIFKADPMQAQNLALFGWGLTKIYPRFSISKIPDKVSVPTIASVDSNIVRMISIITPQSCHQLIGDLSNIYSRYSFVQGCRDAEQYIYNSFNDLGLEASYFNYQYSGTNMRNVIGQITGQTAPESIIIVCAHLDCTSENRTINAPGAEDNASGIAAILEAARALSGYPSGLTVRFIAFTGEEQGLIGSDNYAQFVQSQGEIVVAVINVDMAAYSGAYSADMHVFSDPRSFWLGEMAANIISTYTSLDTISHYEYSPRWGSDHYPFAVYGYPAIFLIDAWDGFDWYPYYHTTADTLGNLDMNQEAAIVGAVTAMTAILARPDFGPSYLPGDANGSGAVNGVDVVFLVNYFKGGRPPDPILCGDANGDCRTNGLDVVYLVNYLKGGSAPFSGRCD